MGMEAELVIPEVALLCEGPGASLSSVFLAFGDRHFLSRTRLQGFRWMIFRSGVSHACCVRDLPIGVWKLYTLMQGLLRLKYQIPRKQDVLQP